MWPPQLQTSSTVWRIFQQWFWWSWFSTLILWLQPAQTYIFHQISQAPLQQFPSMSRNWKCSCGKNYNCESFFTWHQNKCSLVKKQDKWADTQIFSKLKQKVPFDKHPWQEYRCSGHSHDIPSAVIDQPSSLGSLRGTEILKSVVHKHVSCILWQLIFLLLQSTALQHPPLHLMDDPPSSLPLSIFHTTTPPPLNFEMGSASQSSLLSPVGPFSCFANSASILHSKLRIWWPTAKVLVMRENVLPEDPGPLSLEATSSTWQWVVLYVSKKLRTAINYFGLSCKYQKCPTCISDMDATLASFVDHCETTGQLHGHCKILDIIYPYSNVSLFYFEHWHYKGNEKKTKLKWQKMQQLFENPDFDFHKTRGVNFNKIDNLLAQDVQSPWGGPGWMSSTMTIEVPTGFIRSRKSIQNMLLQSTFNNNMMKLILKLIKFLCTHFVFPRSTYALWFISWNQWLSKSLLHATSIGMDFRSSGSCQIPPSLRS